MHQIKAHTEASFLSISPAFFQLSSAAATTITAAVAAVVVFDKQIIHRLRVPSRKYRIRFSDRSWLAGPTMSE